MRTLNLQELTDILAGCAILGTGGGGEPDEGLRLINDALGQGKEFRMVSLDEAPQDALVCTPYMLGAISELPSEEEAQYERLPRIDQESILLAYERIGSYLGQDFYGTISCELGGSNTAIAFYAAAMSGHYIIDADPAGRAVPEITHSTYYFNGLPAAPIVMANEFGECIICENVMDDQRSEVLVRALAKVSRNNIAAIDHALPVHQIRNAVIPGAITMALELGQRHRQAKANHEDVPQAIATAGGGYVAFRGNVSACDWKTEGGFTLGNIEIEGSGKSSGSEYKIWLKNENLIAWMDDEVHTTIPDLICLIDTATGNPVTNPNYAIGMKVAVVILPAPKEFTTEKGLAAFGPAYVGLDQPYRPSVTTHLHQSV